MSMNKEVKKYILNFYPFLAQINKWSIKLNKVISYH